MGHKNHIKGSFYEADLPEWDMIIAFQFFDNTHPGVLPHRRTLLVEEIDKFSLLRMSQKPEASLLGPAEPEVLTQAVRSVSTPPPSRHCGSVLAV